MDYSCKTCGGDFNSYDQWFSHLYRCELSNKMISIIKSEEKHLNMKHITCDRTQFQKIEKKFSRKTQQQQNRYRRMNRGSRKLIMKNARKHNRSVKINHKNYQRPKFKQDRSYRRKNSNFQDELDVVDASETESSNIRRSVRIKNHSQSFLNTSCELVQPTSSIVEETCFESQVCNAIVIEPKERKKMTYSDSKIMLEFDLEGKFYRLLADTPLEVVTIGKNQSEATGECSNSLSIESTKLEACSELGCNSIENAISQPSPRDLFDIAKEITSEPQQHHRLCNQPYRRYISPSNEEMDEMLEYDMDDQDLNWINLVNEQRLTHLLLPSDFGGVSQEKLIFPSEKSEIRILNSRQLMDNHTIEECLISENTFESLMDRFEKRSVYQRFEMNIQENDENIIEGDATIDFDKSHSTLSSSSVINHISNLNFNVQDADSVCCICLDGDCSNTNMIVFCDICNMAVHQECYGIPYVPEGQWLCRKCYTVPSRSVECALCPHKEGAFKTTSQGIWVHVLCAVWIPEAHFSNPVFMEPVDISSIPASRYRLKCSICQSPHGACIQCSYAKCCVAYHVTCALYSGLLIRYLYKQIPRSTLRHPSKKKLILDSETVITTSSDEIPDSPTKFTSDISEKRKSFCLMHYDKCRDQLESMKNVKILHSFSHRPPQQINGGITCTTDVQKIPKNQRSSSKSRVFQTGAFSENKKNSSSSQLSMMNGSSYHDVSNDNNLQILSHRSVTRRMMYIPMVNKHTLTKALDVLPETLTFRREHLIEMCQKYWMIKRYQRGGIPFLRRLQASNSSLDAKSVVDALVDEVSRENEISTFTGEDKRIEIFEKILSERRATYTSVRKNLEKLRLIVELVRIREKTKCELDSVCFHKILGKYFPVQWRNLVSLSYLKMLIQEIEVSSTIEHVKSSVACAVPIPFGINTERVPSSQEFKKFLIEMNIFSSSQHNFSTLCQVIDKMCDLHLLGRLDTPESLRDTFINCIEILQQSSGGDNLFHTTPDSESNKSNEIIPARLYHFATHLTRFLHAFGPIDQISLHPALESNILQEESNCTPSLSRHERNILRKRRSVESKVLSILHYLRGIPKNLYQHCTSFTSKEMSSRLDDMNLHSESFCDESSTNSRTSKVRSVETCKDFNSEDNPILLDPKIYPISFPEFSVVWARVTGYPYYPAIIVNPSRVANRKIKDKFFRPVAGIQIPLPKPNDRIMQLFEFKRTYKMMDTESQVSPKLMNGSVSNGVAEEFLVVFLDRLFTWSIVSRPYLNPIAVDRDLDLYHIDTALSSRKYRYVCPQSFLRAYRRALRLVHRVAKPAKKWKKKTNDESINGDCETLSTITDEDWSSDDDLTAGEIIDSSQKPSLEDSQMEVDLEEKNHRVERVVMSRGIRNDSCDSSSITESLRTNTSRRRKLENPLFIFQEKSKKMKR